MPSSDVAAYSRPWYF